MRNFIQKVSKRLRIGLIFFKSRLSYLYKKELAVIAVCLLASSTLYFFSVPTFKNQETVVVVRFFDEDNPLKSYRSTVNFYNDGQETIIDIRTWFKGKGEMELIVPSWFKEQSLFNKGKILSDYSGSGNLKEAVFWIDEKVDDGLLFQRFRANLFYKKCRVNRFSFFLDGLEGEIKVSFNRMDELSLESFVPNPHKRESYEFFEYRLNDKLFKRNSIDFNIINEKYREESQRTIFIIGILIGILCSIIADQILKLLKL